MLHHLKNTYIQIFNSLFFIAIIGIQFSCPLFLSVFKQVNFCYRQYKLSYSSNLNEIKIPIQDWERSNKSEIIIDGNYYDIKSIKSKSADSVILLANLDEFDNLISFFKNEISSEKNKSTSKSQEHKIKIFFPEWFDLMEVNNKLQSSGIHLFCNKTIGVPKDFFQTIYTPPEV